MMKPENSSINLLIIEKDDDTRSGIDRFFRMSGYQVTSVANEQDALKTAAEKGKQDLILYNTYLTPPQSFMAAYSLHCQPQLLRIPMIITSVHDHDLDSLDNPDIDDFTVGYITEVSRLDELEHLVECLQEFKNQ